MSELSFSCMIDPDSLLLDDFQADYRVRLRTDAFSWDNAWDELLQIALHSQGPDVSEIGNTWLGSLVEMDALRPLTSHELASLGHQSVFSPSAWQGIMMLGDRQTWAVPFTADTRVIYYRRSWFERANIDDATAFETPSSLVNALTRLQAHGAKVPWGMPTRGLDVLYNLASWVWDAGGHFRTSDGRRLRLGEPEAQAGMGAFFGLHRFISPPARALDTPGTDALFADGEVAAIISGPWLLNLLPQDGPIFPDVGVAPVPGVPYVGGTNLIIWRHARNVRITVQTIAHLTSFAVQEHCFRQTGNLPSRVEVLDTEPFVSDPRYQAFAQSLRWGRVLKTSYRWAAVQRRLVNLLDKLWSDLAQDPQLDPEAEVARRVADLIELLDQTILANW